ncbi:MAG: hypothetical protein ACP5H7_02600 [Minisyncoccia bacterium]
MKYLSKEDMEYFKKLAKEIENEKKIEVIKNNVNEMNNIKDIDALITKLKAKEKEIVKEYNEVDEKYAQKIEEAMKKYEEEREKIMKVAKLEYDRAINSIWNIYHDTKKRLEHTLFTTHDTIEVLKRRKSELK